MDKSLLKQNWTPNMLELSKKDLGSLNRKNHTNWLVALKEYPGLNSGDRTLINQAATTKFGWALFTQNHKVIQKVEVY